MESQTGLKLEVAGLTDVGCKRTNNEDSYGYDLAAQLFVVCDGMGGMAAGEVASSTAVNTLLRAFSQNTASSAGIEERLYNAIIQANHEVCALSQTNEEMRGMGTTLVAACIDTRKIVIGNVGDSRAYFLREGGCVQITLDHSYLAEQVRNGTMTADDAGASPLQSLITRAIGTSQSVEPDLFSASLEPGDMVLLTTDGLTRYADAGSIAQIVLNQPDLQQACQMLINTAKEQGAVDNVTCLLLRFSE
ncbi:MAG TPA: Stp1/IreP family PP2C-type Ser/Thr phosphatase [Alloacidobacterium sp.]|jgi:serine/threonine protein phosphatase PrpC|nr:Stp1/IreP family PP2C-type Ser/Thr phosphatase [Alloacidobacterium sp.]